MRILILALVIGMPTMSINVAEAKNLDSGNTFYPGCKDHIEGRTPTQLGSLCLATVSGTAVMLLSDMVKDEYKFCPSPHVTNTQLVRIVVKYMDDHPQKMAEPLEFLTQAALQRAFPCS